MKKTDANAFKMIKMMRMLRSLHPDWTDSKIKKTAAQELRSKQHGPDMEIVETPEGFISFEHESDAPHGKTSRGIITR